MVLHKAISPGATPLTFIESVFKDLGAYLEEAFPGVKDIYNKHLQKEAASVSVYIQFLVLYPTVLSLVKTSK